MFTRSIVVAATAIMSLATVQAYAQDSTSRSEEILKPATKLEAFKPEAGSLITLGYDNLDGPWGISIDVREVRDKNGVTVRGIVVEVRESQYREGRSFIDADEVPELIKGLEALLEVKENPTNFESFEVGYETRGELKVTVYNSFKHIRYAVRAGRVLKASKVDMNDKEIRKMKAAFEAALKKIAERSAATSS